jgi:hypothetical protein
MKWIEEVNKVVQGLKGEMNDTETRKGVTQSAIDILNKHSITAFVDCSARVNTPEVVNNGSFYLAVKTREIDFLFKFTGDK